jgi:Ca2+-transporting ATPase
MKFYCAENESVLQEVKSSEDGLSSQEAEERIRLNGKNKLAEPEKEGLFKKFLYALSDPMIFLLLGAAAISTATTIYQNLSGGGEENYADLFIILFVVIVNTVLSMVQESKAEQAIEALMEMTAATSRVLRDGEIITVKSEDLAVGDVVILEAGDAVPADCRVLESHSMKVEEAALTGESVPVTKIVDLLMCREGSRDIPLGDRRNMVYSGSTVVYGRGRAVVTAAGMDTEMGKIADALSQAKAEETPLQKKLSELSITLTKLVIAICVFVFAFGVVRDVFIVHTGASVFDVILDTFIISVALAVAAIPEGLPAVTTIILSIGVTSMSKRNALIRRLTAVETLGCTQVICSDKTGTLTQNRMTVVDTFTEDSPLLAKAMALCSDAKRKRGMHEASGEPTECALVNHAHDLRLYKDELDDIYPRVGEAPFDSGRKMMSTVHQENGRIVQYTKGACEILLDRCTGFIRDGEVQPITEEYRIAVRNRTRDFANRALRVLGAACRVHDRPPESCEPEALERDLVFIGFVGMIDPCRPEVYGAIQECREAGIRPIMITGDHKDTAVAIARDLGIIDDASQAIEGAALDDLSDEELKEAVLRYSVYARVQPEHKTRIVRAWKARGLVTAMTGDGVNDAPSIKAADIGVGMGITGTAVTKSVSDMVLADDNFATIVSAVEEGRKVFDNVRKVIQFQLTTNLAEIVSIFLASMLGFRLLNAAHLLWINLVTDSAPGLALGMEKAEAGLMLRKPRPMSEGLFSGGAGIFMGLQGTLMGLLILFSYFFGVRLETGVWSIGQSADGMTMAFLTCNFVEMFRAFGTRSLTGSILTMKTRNWWLWGALTWTFVLTCSVIFIPAFRSMFGFTDINLNEFLIAMALAFSVIPTSEIIKFFQRRRLTKEAA